jgi:hypothetical protein
VDITSCHVTAWYGIGDGLPLFMMHVANRTMRQLPRWNDDFYFWVWSESSTTNNPNCVQTPNPLTPEPTHTWGDNWFCSATDKASVLAQWSLSGAILGQNCLSFDQVNETVRWKNKMNLCIHPMAPYSLQWTQTGAISGLSCVPVREGSDPYWDDGLKQICGTSNTPYNGDQYQLYQYAPPILTSITPSHGPTIGGTVVTVRGYSFGKTIGSLYIGSSACTIISSTYNHTYFTCTTPSGEGQTNVVTMTVNTQTQQNTLNFNYDAPIVTSITPQTGLTSGGGTVTIAGSNFGATSGTAAIGTYYCAVVTWADTIVTCTLPTGMGVSLAVVLTTFDSSDSNTNVVFNYTKPNITSVAPSSYYTQGGITITIGGSSFGGTGVARVGGSLCVTVSWSHTLITCTLPAGSGSKSAITVTTATQVNNVFYFNFYAPIITDLTPTAAASGSSVYLTLTGTSFGTSSVGTVTVAGLACASTSSQYSDTRILCSLPNGVGYRVSTVVLVNDQYSNNVNFTYTPVITSISYVNASTQGGTPVSIDGTSFAANPSLTSVTIGGTLCPIKSTTSTRVICTLPVGQGADNIVTLGIDGQSAPTSTLSYDAPVLNSVTPSSGGTAGGFNLTLSGANFGTLATVTLGVSSCPVLWQSHTSIICNAPAGSGQSNAVVVTVSSQQSSSLGFNYNAPTITGFWPINGAIDGGIPITLRGTELASSGLVTIGTNVVLSTYVNSTIATFVLPAGTGVVNLLIRIDSQTSNSVVFTYDGPSITSVSPLSATTDATSVIIALIGTSFGSGAVVYVGGVQCPAYALGVQSSTHYDCSLAAGQGTNLAVVMKVSTQTSAETFLFNYTAPTISQPLSPSTGVTSGGNLVTITGTSFGTYGIVTIGSSVCSTSASGASWSHTKIVCSVAVGQGVGYIVHVSVTDPNTQLAQTNDNTNTVTLGNVRYYSYSPPSITSLSPNPGPSVGMTEVIIKGINFGTLATVTIGGLSCPPSFAQSHVQFACILPRGQGTGKLVNITVGPQWATSTYDYAAPVISSISPLSDTTSGGAIITLTGTGFGDNTQHSLVFGGTSVSATVVNITTQTTMTFTVPAGTGVQKDFVLTVAGQTVTSSLLFKYAAPTINGVAGCPADLYPLAISCPVAGDANIAVIGANFGTVIANVNVTIGGYSCPVTNVTHTTINCTLPSNAVGGFTLPVVVFVSSQSAAANYLSYSGPTITSHTLVNATLGTIARRLLTTSITGNITMLSSDGGVVTFGGTFFGTDASDVSVRYGHSNTALSGQAQFEDKPFLCGSVIVTQTSDGTSTCTCTMVTGTGRDLVFQIKVGQQYSAEGTDLVSYPRPVILPNTIRLVTSDATFGDRVVGANSEGDLVFIDVNYIGGSESLALLIVTYGYEGAIKDQSCTPVTTGTYNGQTYISCPTAPGYGSLYQFEVTANGQTSAPGTDYYSYVSSPVVYSVNGCANNTANATSQCPTEGGTLITIIGDNFGENALSVHIGTQTCIGVTYYSVTKLTCTVPEGTGSPTSVVVIFGQRYSRSVNYLSYAAATVTQVTGCTDVGTSTTLCSRGGGDTLTLTGDNFGPATPVAIVVVGSQYCANVVMDSSTPHTKLTCTAPTGTDLTAAVLLRQGQGVLSQTSVTVGYVQCAIGTYAASGVVTCASCAAGSYSDDVGQATCKACESGDYASITGATICNRCSQGTYSVLATGATIGATNCTNCTSGTYGASQAASSCSSCVGGYYADTWASTACIACATGSHMKTGLTYCSLCEAGKYMGVSAAYKDSCNTCPTGTYSPVSFLCLAPDI